MRPGAFAFWVSRARVFRLFIANDKRYLTCMCVSCVCVFVFVCVSGRRSKLWYSAPVFFSPKPSANRYDVLKSQSTIDSERSDNAQTLLDECVCPVREQWRRRCDWGASFTSGNHNIVAASQPNTYTVDCGVCVCVCGLSDVRRADESHVCGTYRYLNLAIGNIDCSKLICASHAGHRVSWLQLHNAMCAIWVCVWHRYTGM